MERALIYFKDGNIMICSVSVQTGKIGELVPSSLRIISPFCFEEKIVYLNEFHNKKCKVYRE